jgi:MFS transporter, ACDE family, multidrug resistance protein
VSTLASRDQLGASIGAAQSFKEFGDMVGPLVVGLITQLFGVRAGFVSCGAVALVALMLFRPFGRERSLAPNKLRRG